MANFSAVVGIATSFRNALDRGYNYPVQIMTDQWARVEEILEGDMVRAAAAVAEIQARGDPIPVWRVTELERIQSLLRQLRIQVDVINARTEGPLLDAIQARQVDGWRNAAETFKAAAREPALSRGTRDRIGVAFDKLGTEAAEIITAISFESSLPLREIMDRAYGQAAVGMINQLIAGVAKGQGPRETARRMRDGAALGLNHLLLVARDQQIRAYREGQRAAYQRTGMVTHYKRLAARNSRTCMACIALDGTIWEVADIMPLHPQDRCTMIPVLDGEDAPT